jgi:hypothetical protein
VDGQEVEVSMEAGENGVFLVIFIKVRSRGSQEMRARN